MYFFPAATRGFSISNFNGKSFCLLLGFADLNYGKNEKSFFIFGFSCVCLSGHFNSKIRVRGRGGGCLIDLQVNTISLKQMIIFKEVFDCHTLNGIPSLIWISYWILSSFNLHTLIFSAEKKKLLSVITKSFQICKSFHLKLKTYFMLNCNLFALW